MHLALPPIKEEKSTKPIVKPFKQSSPAKEVYYLCAISPGMNCYIRFKCITVFLLLINVRLLAAKLVALKPTHHILKTLTNQKNLQLGEPK